MGWWRTRNGVIGDGPADILAKFLDDVEGEYMKEVGRLPTQGEIADLIEFGSAGVFSVKCGNTEHPWTHATSHDDDTPRHGKCGEHGSLGACAGPPKGHLANVDPSTGEHCPAPPPIEDTSDEQTD